MTGGAEEQIRSPRALFAQRFTELYEAAGNPTLRRVAAAAETRMRAAQGTRPGGASAQRISDWKAGRNVPARFESLLPVVLTLIELARKTGNPLPREIAEPREWQRLWHAATTWNPDEDAESACPYPGLNSYCGNNSDLFFGRTRATAELATLIRETTGPVAVIGASGAGKSSLLAAGLIPALTDWETTTLTPGEHPLTTVDEAALVPRTEGPRRLVIVDQFEELFTTCRNERDREEFLTLLNNCATRTDDPIAVLVALRADFYAHCLNYLILQEALEHRSYLLGPMRTDELAEAISGPARKVGLELEPGLEELVITELCGAGDHHGRRSYDPGALPLLSHVMAATWQHREGRRLTANGYRKAGGVVGSVAETAEHAWTELTTAQQSAAREILLGLVTVSQDSRDTRRQARRPDLLRRASDPEDATAALELLSRTRLITLDADAVTLTHEIVLTAWPRLRAWIDDDRVGYLVRQRIETDAAEWAAQERDSSLLYRGTRLRNALEHVDPPPVGALAAEFLTAATTARDHTRRRSSRTKAILAILGVALLALGFTVYTQTRLVGQQRDDKNFAATLTEADRVQSLDPSLAAQLNLIAWRLRPGDQEVRSRLLQTQNTPLATVITAHPAQVIKIGYRAGGTVLASLGRDGDLRMWDSTDPQHPRALGTQLDGIGDMAFSPSGALLATTNAVEVARGITLWDTTVPEKPRRLTTVSWPDLSVFSRVAFAPDGHTLAVLTATQLTLWNVSDPAAPALVATRQLHGLDAPVMIGDLRFSPTRPLLALTRYDENPGTGTGTVQLWDITDPAAPNVLAPSVGGTVYSPHTLTFSPDGNMLAFGSRSGPVGPLGNDDAVVQLWDIADPAHSHRYSSLQTDTGAVMAMAFAPDGRTLATDGARAATLWNVADPANPTRSVDHLSISPGVCRVDGASTPCSGGPSALAFAPDGTTLAAGGFDGDLRMWSLPTAVLPGHAGWARTPAFDATGTRMATIATDGRIELWDLRKAQAPQLIGEYRTDHAFAWIKMSPDGANLLLTSGGLERPQLLDISDPAHIHVAADWGAADAHFYNLTLSDDWRSMATLDGDNTLQLWDLTNRAQPRLVSAKWTATSSVSYLSFGADGKTLVIRQPKHTGDRDDSITTLLDTSDPIRPVELANLETPATAGSTGLVVSPDRRIMVVIRSETTQSFDITDPAHPRSLGEPIALLPLAINQLLFGSDSRTVLTSSGDGAIQMWDFTDPAHPARAGTLVESAPYTWSTVLAPNRPYAAAGGRDGAIRLWDLDEQHAVDHICAVTGKLWTQELWQRYLPQLPYRPPC